MTILTREFPSTLVLRDDGDGRVLVGPLLPWGTTARVVDRGRLVVETFERGALAGADPGRIPLTSRHPRDAGELPIGRLVELEERDDAAWMAARVSRTAAGDEVLELARDGVPLGLSIGFMEVPGGSRWSPDRSRVTRTKAALDHVAIVRVPAYAGAGVVGVRHEGGARPTLPLAHPGPAPWVRPCQPCSRAAPTARASAAKPSSSGPATAAPSAETSCGYAASASPDEGPAQTLHRLWPPGPRQTPLSRLRA
jgi:uncharacterized protein